MQIKIRKSPDFFLVSFNIAKLARFNRAVKSFKQTIPVKLRRFDTELKLWCVSRQAATELNTWIGKYSNAEIIKEEILWNWFLNQPPDTELRRAVKIFREKNYKEEKNAAPKKKTDLSPRLVKLNVS